MELVIKKQSEILPVETCCECGSKKPCRYRREINSNTYVWGEAQMKKIYLCQDCYDLLYNSLTGELNEEYQ